MFSEPNTKIPYLKMAIFGPASSGKTSLCLSAGFGSKPVAMFDTERGTETMASGFAGPGGEIYVPNMKVRYTQSPSELLEALLFLERNAENFSALGVDSGTVLWEVAQFAFMNSNTGRVQLSEWNAVKMPIKQAFHRIMSLPLPVIFSCRQRELYRKKGNELELVGYAPDYEKSIDYVFNLVLRMYSKNGRFFAEVYKTRMHEWPVGTIIEDPTWDKIMTPIAHRFDPSSKASRDIDLANEGARLYGNGGLPQVSREEILDKVAGAKALAHLQNIVKKYNQQAKEQGWKAELDKAYKAKERSFIAPPPAESTPNTAEAPGQSPSNPPASESPAEPQGGESHPEEESETATAAVPEPDEGPQSRFRAMTFEQLLPEVSSICAKAGNGYVQEFAAAVGTGQAEALADLAERVEHYLETKEVA